VSRNRHAGHQQREVIVHKFLACAALSVTVWSTDVSAGNTEIQISELERRIKMGLPPDGQTLFDNVQSAWKQYRDLNCQHRQTSYPLMVSEHECRAGYDAIHINELRMELQWLTGIAGKFP